MSLPWRFSAGSAPCLSLRARLTPCAPLMVAFESATAGWLLSAMLLAVPVALAWPEGTSPDVGRRWRLAIIALSAPLFCPTRGVASTIVTGLSVVVATRLPDVPTRPQDESWPSRVLWLLTPMVRRLPTDPARRAENRKGAARLLLRGAIKRLCWEPFGFWMTELDPQQAHWLLKTAFLVLYFVLNLTALADLALALARLLGADTEELFDAPLLAISPREFWSRRWNRYISRFALRHVARPLGPRWPRPVVMMAVFVASAVFHEYFAWGAAGPATRPGTMTAFFLAQGLVVALGERFPAPAAVPRVLRHLATVAWMLVTAPWFFASLRPPLMEFGFPAAWLLSPE